MNIFHFFKQKTYSNDFILIILLLGIFLINFFKILPILPFVLLVIWGVFFFTRRLLINDIFFFTLNLLLIFALIISFLNNKMWIDSILNCFLFFGYYQIFLLNKDRENNKIKSIKQDSLLLYFVTIFFIISSLFFSNPNEGGMHFSNASSIFGAVLFIIFFYKTLFENENKDVSLIHKIILLILILLLVKFSSKSTWLGLSAVVLLTLIIKLKIIKAIIDKKLWFLLFGFLILFFYDFKLTYTDSIMARIFIYKNCITMNTTLEEIIFGNGINSFTEKYFCFVINNVKNFELTQLMHSQAYMHSPVSEFLSVYTEFGLTGIILLLLFIFLILRKGIGLVNIKSFIFIFFIFSSIFNFGFLQLSFSPLFAYSTSLFYMKLTPLNQKLKNLNQYIVLCSFIMLLTFKTIEILIYYDRIVDHENITIKVFKSSYILREIYIMNKFRNLEYKSIVDFYEKLDKKAFKSYQIYEKIAYSYYKNGNYSEAEKMLLISSNLNPIKFKPYLTLIRFYKNIGLFDKIKDVQNKVKRLPVKIKNKESLTIRDKILNFK